MRNRFTKIPREIKLVFALSCVFFGLFLAAPMVILLGKAFADSSGFGTGNFQEVIAAVGFFQALANSFKVSAASAACATLLAFLIAYTVNYTNLPESFKNTIVAGASVPMLLPTISYGFAILYSFGKQGLVTSLLGFQLFEIYGFSGLFMGYVIYTLPIAFLLINNTFRYIDKRFVIVSRMMGDTPLKTFAATAVRPMIGTLGAAFLQCFFLSFTDYGIPAAVGGEYHVTASVLYSQMLGAIPNFGRGAVVALFMLLPSVASIVILRLLEKTNFRYSKVSEVECKKNGLRDGLLGTVSAVVILAVLSVFLVIFVIPFVSEWPYDKTFTLAKFTESFSRAGLGAVYKNSVLTAALTAGAGTLLAYGCALATERSSLHRGLKQAIESMSLVTNTVPGMVLGIAFLFAFSGTPLQNTVWILVLCNTVHFFSTPYLMMKNSLSKMNGSWETTARLMGDSWLKTVVRIITPNAKPALLDVFSYYFVNSMVTVSAVIFLAGARTMVLTAKIKELQHYAQFDQIFVLSLLIFITNLTAQAAVKAINSKNKKENKKMNWNKLKRKALPAAMALIVAGAALFTGCSGGSDQIIIYTNADEEAKIAVENALNAGGYEGQYLVQSFGTSELGGKLMAEGANIEADLITMSSYYIDSAQEQHSMFRNLDFEYTTLQSFPSFYAPLTAQEGAIIVNTELLAEAGLPVPASLKDLSDPIYAGHLSITDITGSSTGWLLVQAVVDAYGEAEAKDVMRGLIANAGAHLESSGSGPIKKIRAGEVAVGFGLRHQAVADAAKGLPVAFVDPLEGNFSLTESVAVIDKGDKTNQLAMEMAECIINNARAEIIESYPLALYQGETADSGNMSAYPKAYPEKLTVELLTEHQAFSESCK